MCRLILMNKEGEKEIEKQYGLENYLNYLKNQFGGDGNGYALLKKGKVVKFEKGVKLSIKDIARSIRKYKYDWCIFHTRYASIGAKSNENCHPFIRGNEVMAMNGTERSVDLVSSVKGITDTEAILDLKVLYNWEIPFLKRLNSIFIGFSKGKPYVVANNTYNIKLLYNKKNNAIVFASDFPNKMNKYVYEANSDFLWNDDSIDLNLFSKRRIIKVKRNQLKMYKDVFEDEYDFFYDYDIYDYYRLAQKVGDKNAA